MTLIRSIAGIRGTIGGEVGENLTPLDVVKFTAAFASWIRAEQKNPVVVIGRDARPSGAMITPLVSSALRAMGIDVIDLGLSTTPTVEFAVPAEKAGGGIVITASHNPAEWNALKLLNHKGELLTEKEGAQVEDAGGYVFADASRMGGITVNDAYIDRHIKAILELPLVDVEAIRKRAFRVVVDAVNSSGGIAVPRLLEALSVEYKPLHCDPTGQFAHHPEPLPENLAELSEEVRSGRYDLGIAVDPDVDRLALVMEDGSAFGEEYTLVAAADYVMARTGQYVTVSNLSSTMALREITEVSGGKYYGAPVGEAHVVAKMKEYHAVIGGEGNGGVIYPELHYGRDALVGIALILSHLARSGKSLSQLKAGYPKYVISKNRIALRPGIDLDAVLNGVKELYNGAKVDMQDGLKIDLGREWIHLRRSNTEPIIRIFAESETREKADLLAARAAEEIERSVNA